MWHIEALAPDGQAAAPEGLLVEQALARLVETTDSVYDAYILKQQDGGIAVVADSSAADSAASRAAKRGCGETASVNRLPFETGQGLLTKPISLPCGEWIRALAPIYDSGGKRVIAVLGLNYSSAEWRANLRKQMPPTCWLPLVWRLLFLRCFISCGRMRNTGRRKPPAGKVSAASRYFSPNPRHGVPVPG